jgi:hypothetical protein
VVSGKRGRGRRRKTKRKVIKRHQRWVGRARSSYVASPRQYELIFPSTPKPDE